jgi:hypothetical protein
MITFPQSVKMGNPAISINIATPSAMYAVPAHINRGKSLGFRIRHNESETIVAQATLKSGPILPVNGSTSVGR